MENGFTIIELMISIFILSVALVGIFSAFSIVAILTSDSADRLTGAYLAQEGIEIVRNIRDTNWLNMDAAGSSTHNWDDGLVGCDSTTAGCEADYTTYASLAPFVGYLNIEDANGFYGYGPGTQTKFQRKITITCLPDPANCAADYIKKVIVQVSWDRKATILNSGVLAGTCNPPGGPANCITIESTLYDWYNCSYGNGPCASINGGDGQ